MLEKLGAAIETTKPIDMTQIGDYKDIAKDDGSWGNPESVKLDEFSNTSIENYGNAIEGTGFDDVFNKRIEDQCSSEGIENIKANYENVNNVMSSIKEGINNATTDVDLQKEMKRVETYKGTVFEDMNKEALKDNFESIDLKQNLVETSEGGTKPDVVLRDAKEDFSIGNTDVKKGDNLYAEVKCGSANYIEGQMTHIEKQVLGHNDGKSIVVVSRDYLDIDPQKRSTFEAKLNEKGSDVIVTNVYGNDVQGAMIENLMS